jgi:hypothetical protein
MFNRSHIDAYLDNKDNPKPTLMVAEAELLRLLIENGHSEKEAKFQVKMCKGLGSHIQIGDKMYGIKSDDDE